MIYEDNSIIICNQNTKVHILKENFNNKKLFNYTFISLSEFIKRYTFKITDKAVIFAMEYLSLSYKNALTLIDNIYYVSLDSTYNDSKLILLQDLKRKLIENNLLEFDPIFKEFIKGKKIYLVDQFLDCFSEVIFDNVKLNSEVIYLKEDIKDFYIKHKSFNKYDEEIDWVFNNILQLLLNGTSINKIYIINENSEYNHLITRYSSLYNIPVKLKESESINNHMIIKEFLSNLKSQDKNTCIDILKESDNDYLLNQVIKALNKFYFITDIDLLVRVLESHFDNIYYEDELLEDVIKVVDLSYKFNDDEYVFFISFNNKVCPKTYLDESYLTDKYSTILPITPTIRKNELERVKALYYLSKINHLTTTFSKVTKTENVVSSLLSNSNKILIDNEALFGLNKRVDNLKLGIMLDELNNFNIHNEYLDKLYSSFVDLYKTYDNSFTFVDKELLKEKIKNTIKLSYTSLSTFYKCQFRYYLEKVLYIKHEKDTQAIMIGTIFHNILEKYGTEGFDLEIEKNNQYNNITDPSLKFYFEKLWPDFLLAIKMIDEFKEDTYLTSELHEQEVNIDLSNSYLTRILTGKIDKIIYKNIDGVDYVAIIDYKTGKDIPSLDNVSDGFNLQLPIYAYFLAKTKLLENPKVLGIYLNRILNNVKSTKTKDLLSVKMDALKLDGYSTLDLSLLGVLDKTYQSSKYIKNLSLTKSGTFNRYAKVFSEKDVLTLINTVEELVNDAFFKIEEGMFEINPKVIDKDNKSCKFCPYLNICYRKNKDLRDLEVKKFVENVGDDSGIY